MENMEHTASAEKHEHTMQISMRINRSLFVETSRIKEYLKNNQGSTQSAFQISQKADTKNILQGNAVACIKLQTNTVIGKTRVESCTESCTDANSINPNPYKPHKLDTTISKHKFVW